jgi:Holliday junction resolvase
MSAQKEGLKTEKWVRDLVGGMLTPASGAIQASLDIRSVKRWGKEFLVEVKSTSKESFRVTKLIWRKVVSRAEMRMACPALCVVFRTRLSGRKPIVIIRREDAPPDFPVEKEEKVKGYRKKDFSLALRPIDEITLFKWEDEEIIAMPLYLWEG